MRHRRIPLRSSLVGLALIFSGGLGAAGLTCTTSRDGYRCEAWPQGSDYRYRWHIVDGTALAGEDLDGAERRIRCPADHASVIAVSVIAPAGYVETATRLLPICGDLASADTAFASAF